MPHYQDVVPYWQEHDNDQLCHSRHMSEFGSFPYSASEIEFAREQYYPNGRYISPSSCEDAFDQNKLILLANSPEDPVPYSSLSSRMRTQKIDLKLPRARSEKASINEEDDAISKPPRSERPASVSSTGENFKEQGKLTRKRKAVQGSESPSAPHCKRVSSVSMVLYGISVR
jgi:hypothetical protein